MVEACHTEPGRYFMLKSYLTQLILLLYRSRLDLPAQPEPDITSNQIIKNIS